MTSIGKKGFEGGSWGVVIWEAKVYQGKTTQDRKQGEQTSFVSKFTLFEVLPNWMAEVDSTREELVADLPAIINLDKVGRVVTGDGRDCFYSKDTRVHFCRMLSSFHESSCLVQCQLFFTHFSILVMAIGWSFEGTGLSFRDGKGAEIGEVNAQWKVVTWRFPYKFWNKLETQDTNLSWFSNDWV